MVVNENEGMLFGAVGVKVHDQTKGGSGDGQAKVNTFAVLAVTMRTNVLVDGVSFLQEGVGGPRLFLVTNFVMVLLR